MENGRSYISGKYCETEIDVPGIMDIVMRGCTGLNTVVVLEGKFDGKKRGRHGEMTWYNG